ncbi:hypothetical protein V6N13_147805 [Hibiscus sabdariffa]
MCKIGKWKECEASLQRDNADISDEADEIIGYTEQLQQLSESMFDLFQKEYAWSISLTVGVGWPMVLQQFGRIDGIAFYASSIFESACTVIRVHIYIILINAFLNDRKNLQYVPMTALGVILLDKSG